MPFSLKYFLNLLFFLTFSFWGFNKEAKANRYISDSFLSEQCKLDSLVDSDLNNTITEVCDSDSLYELIQPTIDLIIDNVCSDDSSKFALKPKKRLIRAIGEGVFVNAFVWAADRWLLGKDYYSKGWTTLKDNIEKGWSWDGDAFSTNFIDHPYHGNLYYTGARTSGCDFWASALLTAIGSVEWEEIAETDFPSHNDLFSTTFGGAALGEVTLRVSNIILNDKTRGVNRFLRELSTFGLSPMRGLNRMIDGDTWKHRDSHYLYHDKKEIPYTFFISAGNRWADTKNSSARNNVSFNIKIDYGKFGSVRQNKPYDCFLSNMTFNTVGTHVPLVSAFCINGRLHGWQVHETDKTGTVFSINQDFVYYNNEQQEMFKGDRTTLLSLSETAALGPAISFESSVFRHMLTSNLVFMGGYTSDYYYRDYNMGSGFNVKAYNSIRISNILFFSFDASYHYLFTWKGYEKDQIRKYQNEKKTEPYIFNTAIFRKAGDKAYSSFFILNPRVDLKLIRNFYVTAQLHYFTRNSVYKYFDNVKSHYADFNVSLTYKIE